MLDDFIQYALAHTSNHKHLNQTTDLTLQVKQHGKTASVIGT
jgi:hypothetical protein